MKIRTTYIFLSLFLVASLPVSSQEFTIPQSAKSRGIPAYPFPVTVQQPTGGAVELKGMGDGFLHWYETVDGYTVLKDAKERYVYAIHNTDGQLVPSEYILGESKGAPEGIAPHLRHSAQQVASLSKSYFPDSDSKANPSPFPSTGSNNTLVILVEFPDRPAFLPEADIDNLMNLPGYSGTGSFYDYYMEASYGSLSLQSNIEPWVMMSENMSYYGANDIEGYDRRPDVLVREAVDSLEANGFDFSPYDNDGDGYVDEIIVFHAGYGEHYIGAGDTCIWSHSFHLGDLSVEYDGVMLDNYLITSELSGNSGSTIAPVGIVVHEFSHSLGLPDLYDIDAEGSGGYAFDLNFWDLMAAGAWNDFGHSPAGINAWLKKYMGWMTIPVIEATGTFSLEAASEQPDAYQLNTPVYNEYFIVENRQRTGFDRGLLGEGMLIYHVDLNYPGWLTGAINVDPAHQGFDLVEADDIRDTITINGDPFPGAAGVTAFDSLTTPSSNTWNGESSQVSIQNIASSSGVITFDILSNSYDSLPPGWFVDALSYTGQGFITAMVLMDSDTVVTGNLGAFAGEECRGITAPTYDPVTGHTLFELTAFSNAPGTDTLAFRYYDPVADSTYALYETLVFVNGSIAGSAEEPFIFHPEVRYTKSLVAGWNWLSLNVGMNDMSPAAVFGNCSVGGNYVKNQTQSSTYYEGFGWAGTLTALDNNHLFVIKSAQACEIDLPGIAVQTAASAIELVSGWNWVAYTPQWPMSPADALASLTPVEGDYVKNQTQSATYYDGFGWLGTLTEMKPGEGYMIRLVNGGTLVYPDVPPGN